MSENSNLQSALLKCHTQRLPSTTIKKRNIWHINSPIYNNYTYSVDNVVSLLPQEFTLTDLIEAYDIV